MAKTVMMALTAMTHTHTYYISQSLPVGIADWVIKRYSANCRRPFYMYSTGNWTDNRFSWCLLLTRGSWKKLRAKIRPNIVFCQQIFFSNCPLKSGLGVRKNIFSQLCPQWSRISCSKLFCGKKPTMVPQAVSDTM